MLTLIRRSKIVGPVLALFAAACVATQVPPPVPASPPAPTTAVPTLPPVRIILVGDSTVAAKSGWGPGFAGHVVPQATLVNLARGGRSSSSFRKEGLWAGVMEQLARGAEFKATYVLIQFGHNDQPGKPGRSTDLTTEFPANLRNYVADIRAAGAKPVLLTSLTRRGFKDGHVQNDLAPWADATKRVASEMGVPVLDLNADSAAAVQEMGPVEANTLAAAAPPPVVAESAASGNSVAAPKTPPSAIAAVGPEFDYTHLGAKGAAFFGAMVADELEKTVADLRPYITHAVISTPDAAVVSPTPDAAVVSPTPDAAVASPTRDAAVASPARDAAVASLAPDAGAASVKSPCRKVVASDLREKVVAATSDVTWAMVTLRNRDVDAAPAVPLAWPDARGRLVFFVYNRTERLENSTSYEIRGPTHRVVVAVANQLPAVQALPSPRVLGTEGEDFSRRLARGDMARAEQALVDVVAGCRSADDAVADLRPYLAWLESHYVTARDLEKHAGPFITWLKAAAKR